MKRNGNVKGGGGAVVLLRLQHLSRWRLLFLSDQSGRAEALRNMAAASGWGASFLRRGKRRWGRGPFYRDRTSVDTKRL
jgi:hypothetical protein